jgi:alkylation response protein AidB-like acyl-CoA dehydrogenase
MNLGSTEEQELLRKTARERNGKAAITASMAKAYVGDAYRHTSAENIQIHGGVGFTWEYD